MGGPVGKKIIKTDRGYYKCGCVLL